MSKTKKLFLSVLTLALACCFTIGLSSVKTFAATTPEGFDVTGASIRVVKPYGLRFHTQVPEGEKDNYTYGTLIIPKADLVGNELTYETAKALKVEATQWQSDTEYTVVLGGKADGEGNVTNFPASQYNKPILARSYALDGTGTVVHYTNTIERTYAGIAATGLAVGENVVSNPATIAFLNGIVDGVIGEDGFALTQSELTLEVGSPAVTLTDLVSTENSNEGLTIKWSVDGDCLNVTADEKGIITAISAKTAGVATLTATLGSCKKTLKVNVVGRIIEENEVIDFKFESDIENYAHPQAKVTLSFLNEFQGKQGVMKIEQSGNWARWSFNHLQDLSAYEGATYLVVRMWVESSYVAPENYVYMGLEAAKIYNDHKPYMSINPIETGKWVDYYFKASDFITQWELGWRNYYSAIESSRPSTCYVDKIFVVTRSIAENEVLDILTASDITTYSATKNSTITYLPSYEGATGVAKLQANANWAYFGIKPIQDMSKYENASYLVIRMWVEKCQEGKLWLSGYSDKCYTPVQTGKWVDYYFDGAWFLERWANCVNNYSIDSHAMSVKYSGDVCYIDKVFVAYDCSTLGLEPIVNGNLVEGETLSVTLSNPNDVSLDDVTVTVTDPSGNNVEDITSFVAKIGTYTVTISKDGYLSNIDTFVIERIIAENEVIDYKCASDVVNAYNQDKVTLSYLDTFEGANGVMKVEQSGNWARWMIKPIQDLSVYNGYKYVVIRMWLESNATVNSDFYIYLGRRSDDQVDVKTYSTIKLGRWVDYYFNAENFIEQWTEGWENYYSGVAYSRQSTCYVDKIYVTNEQEVVEVAHANDVSSFVNQNNAPITYVEEYAGVKGVARIDAGSWSELKWTANMALDKYSGKYLVIRMNASVASNFQIAENNGTQLTNVVPGEWTDVYFDANAYLTQWTNTGNYYSALIFKLAGTFYIDSIYITDAVPEEFMYIDFVDETTASSYLKSGGWDIGSTQYYSEFNGANGVMAITADNGYGIQLFNLPAVQGLVTKAYTHFVIRAYADTTSDSSYIRLDNSGSVQQPVEKGVWKDYIFTVEELVNLVNNGSYKGFRFGAAGTYYIDCMYFTNIA